MTNADAHLLAELDRKIEDLSQIIQLLEKNGYRDLARVREKAKAALKAERSNLIKRNQD